MGTRPSGLVWPTWNPYVCLSIAHRAQASCWGAVTAQEGNHHSGPKGPTPLRPSQGQDRTLQNQTHGLGGANPMGHAPIGDDLGEESLPSGRSLNLVRPT